MLASGTLEEDVRNLLRSPCIPGAWHWLPHGHFLGEEPAARSAHDRLRQDISKDCYVR